MEAKKTINSQGNTEWKKSNAGSIKIPDRVVYPIPDIVVYQLWHFSFSYARILFWASVFKYWHWGCLAGFSFLFCFVFLRSPVLFQPKQKDSTPSVMISEKKKSKYWLIDFYLFLANCSSWEMGGWVYGVYLLLRLRQYIYPCS
jgi:hypothetical protein